MLLRAGRSYTLDVYARYGPPTSNNVPSPLLSTAVAHINVPPFGTFGLDPTSMVALPPLLLSTSLGVGSAGFTFPDVPGLAGLSLYAQALVFPYPYQARLTNVTGDVVLR